MEKFYFIFSAFIFLAGFSLINCDLWHYPATKPNGVLAEPENWGGNCKNGRKQSPVDLNYDACVKGHYQPLMFEGYNKKYSQNFSIINNGHSVQISTKPGDILINGGGLKGTYIFDQLHFHWASEHTINERRYGLELHLVHHEKRFDTLAKAAVEKNGIAVLGVLFHISEEVNLSLEKLLKNAEFNIMGTVGKSQIYKDELILDDFLPKNRSSYFRYYGSLTTPGCNEFVVWTIFENSLPINLDQLERFKLMKSEDGQELTHNYRSLQPLNHRALVYVSEESLDHSYHENSASQKSSFWIFLIIVTGIIIPKF